MSEKAFLGMKWPEPSRTLRFPSSKTTWPPQITTAARPRNSMPSKMFTSNLCRHHGGHAAHNHFMWIKRADQACQTSVPSQPRCTSHTHSSLTVRTQIDARLLCFVPEDCSSNARFHVLDSLVLYFQTCEEDQPGPCSDTRIWCRKRDDSCSYWT